MTDRRLLSSRWRWRWPCGDGVLRKRRKSISSWNVLHDHLLSGSFFCTMGKEFMCRCGCDGRHSLESLCRGSWPGNRHEVGAWLPQDRERQDRHTLHRLWVQCVLKKDLAYVLPRSSTNNAETASSQVLCFKVQQFSFRMLTLCNAWTSVSASI